MKTKLKIDHPLIDFQNAVPILKNLGKWIGSYTFLRRALAC
jgi:hypothetical protein